MFCYFLWMEPFHILDYFDVNTEIQVKFVL